MWGQDSRQDKRKDFMAGLDRLQSQAKSAYDREMAREKAGGRRVPGERDLNYDG
jgi:hypothetical protein